MVFETFNLSMEIRLFEILTMFYSPWSKSEALRLGVHLILLYFIGSHSQPRRLLIYLVGGGWWPTFWFLKSLDNNMVYSLGIDIYICVKGIFVEQKSYGF